MSYAQFGYTAYPPSPQLVVSNGSSSPSPCCDRSPGVTGPAVEQAIPGNQAPCPASVLQPSPASAYDSRFLTAAAAATYPRLATAGFYGGTAYTPEQAAYPNLDSSAFYPTLNGAYPSMKEAGDPWRSIAQPTSYYYDSTLAAYGYGGLDFNGTRRKNVTRDSTSTLKAWLNEHRKNPYPTKGEKIMLAIITKMTLTQVSTWFANARRRLKKENKMTWEPRNKIDSDDASDVKKEKGCDDDDDKSDADDSDATGQDEEMQSISSLPQDSATKRTTSHDDTDPCHPVAAYRNVHGDFSGLESSCSLHHHESTRHHGLRPLPVNGFTPSASSDSSASPDLTAIDSLISSPNSDKDEHRNPFQDSDSTPCKPKIWSLADTATSKSPPPPPASPLSMLNHFGNDGSTGKDMCSLTYGGSWFAPSSYHHRNAPGANSGQHFSSSAVSTSGYASGFSPPQTDTPPQTPPNLKVSTAVQLHLHGQSMAAASYLSSQAASHLYLGQCSSTSVCGAPHLASMSPVDKSGGLYTVSHMTSRTPTLHGYRSPGDFQNLAEDYSGTQ